MGPDPWSHNNKEWSRTLQEAKNAGWPEPKFTTNHQVIYLNCPENDRRHLIKIYSTGKGSEAVAREARKTIKKCHHGDFSDKVRIIESHLDAAERLFNAVEQKRLKQVAERQAEELITEEEPLAEEELLSEAAQNIHEARMQLRIGEFEELAAKIQAYQDRLDELVATGVSIDDSKTTRLELEGHVRTVKLALRSELPQDHPKFEGFKIRLEALQFQLQNFKYPET